MTDKAESITRFVLARELGVSGSALRDEDRLEDDLQMGTLDAVEIMGLLERFLGITIGDAEFGDAATVGELVTLVREKAAARVPAP